MGGTGNIVFCPRKTASFSIAKSWSLVQTPVLQTHNLYHFVVIDKIGSEFYEFILQRLSSFLIGGQVKNDQYVQYTIEIKLKSSCRSMFAFFDSFVFVTSTRNPLSRRISQFLESVTVEQVNTVMDSTYPSRRKLELKLHPDVAELCHVKQKIKAPSSCPIVFDALKMIHANMHLLNIDDICTLFEKHFACEITEYTEFFAYMQAYFENGVLPDFNLSKINYAGYDFQEYTFCGIQARHLVVKIENITEPHVKSIFKSFTGINTLSREHDASASHHLFIYPLGQVKNLLNLRYEDSVFCKEHSIEGQIITGLGY